MAAGAFRFVPVVLLLGAAAALLTDYSRPHISVRGIANVLKRGSGGAAHRVSAWRRWLAFALVVAALLVAIPGH